MAFFTLCTCGHDRTCHGDLPEDQSSRPKYAGRCETLDCRCKRFKKGDGQYFPWENVPAAGKLPEGRTIDDVLGGQPGFI